MRTFPGEPPVSDLVAAWEAPIRACRAATTRDTPPAQGVSLPSQLTASVAQPDLYYLEAVLVTAGYPLDEERKVPVGWNKNDEFFDTTECWLARATPEDKPLNRNHDCQDIVGHITSCAAEMLDGTPLPNDSVVIPDSFNLVTNAVIYRVWYDGPEQAHNEERETDIATLIAEVEEGKWQVSMECLVRDFDYALLNRDGSIEIVARTKATAHLTTHLRAAGGKGVYGGRRIARVPRQIIFSGKGLVQNPANPKSVVRAETTTTSASIAVTTHFSAKNPEKCDEKCDEKSKVVYHHTNSNTESTMPEPENLAGQLAALQAQVAELTTENVKLKTGKLAELTDALAAERAEKASLHEAMKTATAQAKAEVDKLASEKAEIEQALVTAKSELEKATKNQKKADRTTALVAALRLNDEQGREKAVALAEQLLPLSDEAFTAHLEVLSAISGPAVSTTTTAPANTNFGGTQTPAPPAKQTSLPGPTQKTNLPPNMKKLTGSEFTSQEGGTDGGADLDSVTPTTPEPDLATAKTNTENIRVLLASCFSSTSNAGRDQE